jgi:hypothetical protein
LVPQPTEPVESQEPSPSALRQEFLNFLIEYRNPEPGFQFSAYAGLADEVPHFAMQYPLGEVRAYNGFLVFLTTIMTRPGIELAVGKFGEMMQKEMQKKANPLAYLGKQFLAAFRTEDQFQQALLSPNSVFIPFRMIRGVNDIPGKLYRSHRIQVVLPQSSLVICQDRHAEHGGTHSWWTGMWQPDFVQFLKTAAENIDIGEHG